MEKKKKVPFTIATIATTATIKKNNKKTCEAGRTNTRKKYVESI